MFVGLERWLSGSGNRWSVDHQNGAGGAAEQGRLALGTVELVTVWTDRVVAGRWVALVVVVAVVGVVLGVGVAAPAAAADAGSGFSDIDEAGPHRGSVEALAAGGVLAGTECAPEMFCPIEPVRRWVMAVWLVRVIDGDDPDGLEVSRFADVDAGEWWVPHVERLAELGVTAGCATGPLRFCPTEAVTRAQMASFLVRAFGLGEGASSGFVDVEGNVHASNIDALAAAGVTSGCSTGPARYCPGRDTTRAQMATFLSRALQLGASGPEQPPDGGGFTTVSAGKELSCGLRSDGTVVCWGNNAWGQADAPEGEFSTVSAGYGHSCGLLADETVVCWGANWDGQTDAPDGKFSTVSAGYGHSCGIRTDWTVVCWGRNSDGQTDAPDGKFSTVSAGYGHSCGIRSDRTVVCWGRNSDGQADVPDGKFRTVSAGYWHSCGIRTDGTVVCWGANSLGQASAPWGEFRTVSAGAGHSCGIRTDGTVVCWGHNTDGRSDPPEGKFRWISAGAGHSCGVRADGTVVCWGHNTDGRSDPPEGKFRWVSAGFAHSCGVRADGTVVCWGHNAWGQADAPEGEFSTVSAGWIHSCGIRTDGTAACWGNNTEGQTVAPEGEFSTVSAGWIHSCGVRTDGTVACWGDNSDGQTEPPEGKFSTVSSGNDYSCGVRTDGTAVCWGNNWEGRADPPAGEFSAVSAGNDYSCGVRTDGTAVCWGNNWEGRADPPAGEFSAVSAGNGQSCGIRADGTAVCWGDNSDGQADAPEEKFSAVATGWVHSCGIRSNGTLECWGRDLVVSSPVAVQQAIWTRGPDPQVCRPKGVEGHTAGFPLPGWALPSTGTIRVATLFVDFPDASAQHSTQREASLGFQEAEAILERSSYGKLDIEFGVLHRWLRAEQGYRHYLTDTPVGDVGLGTDIVREAVRLADDDFDFASYQHVMVVAPSSHFSGGLATGGVDTDEGPIGRTAMINAFGLDEERDRTAWDRVPAHEFVHGLGLLDLYPYDTARHQQPDPQNNRTWITARFGLMSMWIRFLADEQDPRLTHTWHWPDGQTSTGYVGSLHADEMLAWSRWQLGWLQPDQILCVTDQHTTVTLTPVADPGEGTAMVAIPVSESEVIVVENRRRIGYDKGQQNEASNGPQTTLPALATEGVLVYTVDATLGSGELPLKVAGDSGDGRVDDYPILVSGQSVTIHGYTITVVSTTPHTTITITQNPQ